MSNDAVLGLLGVSAIMLTISAIALIVLLIIARWVIFKKAGEKGWKSLIPVYSDYVEWRIGWKRTGFFWLSLLLIVAGAVVGSIDGTFYTTSAGNLAVASNPGTLGMAGCAMMFIAAILKLIATYKLFASFGHGIGWLIGYFFVPNIMLLVLAFGSSRYRGPQ